MNKLKLLLMMVAAAQLAGCVPMMAASAVNMAAKQAAGTPVSNEGLQPQARAACSAEAAKHGTVHIIDIEQARVNRIVVWGTVEAAGRKQSFQCDYGTRITGFKLRLIAVR